MYELYHLALNEETDEKQELLFTISLVDDDPLFIMQMKDYLTSMKITDIRTYASGEEFLNAFKETEMNLVVCDFDFGSADRKNGLEVLEEIKKRNPQTPVIMLSAQDNIAVALQTLKKGAVDYFIKGTQNAFTSVLTSILKINELQRMKKTEKDYITTLVAGSAGAIIIIAILLYNLYK